MTFKLKAQNKAQALRANRGRRVEDKVEELHETHAFRLHAELWRCYPGVRGGRVVKPQGPDFQGLLVESGRHVFVEVKAVLEGHLKLPRPGLTAEGKPRTGAFTVAELERLCACDRHGGLAVVLVLHGPLTVAAWCPIPWAVIEAAIAAGASSLHESRILSRRCQPVDYLRSAEASARNLWRAA